MLVKPLLRAKIVTKEYHDHTHLGNTSVVYSIIMIFKFNRPVWKLFHKRYCTLLCISSSITQTIGNNAFMHSLVKWANNWQQQAFLNNHLANLLGFRVWIEWPIDLDLERRHSSLMREVCYQRLISQVRDDSNANFTQVFLTTRTISLMRPPKLF